MRFLQAHFTGKRVVCGAVWDMEDLPSAALIESDLSRLIRQQNWQFASEASARSINFSRSAGTDGDPAASARGRAALLRIHLVHSSEDVPEVHGSDLTGDCSGPNPPV